MEIISKSQCSRPGCCREVRTRGMCASHYTAWYRTQRKLSKLPRKQPAEDLIMEALPGTIRQLCNETGLSYRTVSEAVVLLRLREWVHVEDVLPPCSILGGRLVNVYGVGPAKDARVTKATKKQHELRGRRRRYQVMRAPHLPDPLIGALFGSSARAGAAGLPQVTRP